jgi:hypothetical protein
LIHPEKYRRFHLQKKEKRQDLKMKIPKETVTKNLKQNDHKKRERGYCY